MNTHDFRLIDDYGLLLETFTRLHRRLMGHVAQDAGLDGPELEVLLRVSRSPGSHLQMGELAEQILLTSGGVTRLIDRMETAGLVQRTKYPGDRRVQWIVVTEAGHERLAQALAVHVPDLESYFAGALAPDEYAAFLSTLKKLHDAGVNAER
jgi:DNA-binding MarR family transcriptional regulator